MVKHLTTASRTADGIVVVGEALPSLKIGRITIGALVLNLTRAQVQAVADILEEIEEALEP